MPVQRGRPWASQVGKLGRTPSGCQSPLDRPALGDAVGVGTAEGGTVGEVGKVGGGTRGGGVGTPAAGGIGGGSPLQGGRRVEEGTPRLGG